MSFCLKKGNVLKRMPSLGLSIREVDDGVGKSPEQVLNVSRLWFASIILVTSTVSSSLTPRYPLQLWAFHSEYGYHLQPTTITIAPPSHL